MIIIIIKKVIESFFCDGIHKNHMEILLPIKLYTNIKWMDINKAKRIDINKIADYSKSNCQSR